MDNSDDDCVITGVFEPYVNIKIRDYISIMNWSNTDWNIRSHIPLQICEEIVMQTSNRNAILQSSLGQWQVKMVRRSENLWCFEDGWPAFVHANKVVVDDYLRFQHVEGLRFHVTRQRERGTFVEFEEPTEAEETIHQAPAFSKIMQPAHATIKWQINIPMHFMRSNNLELFHGVILQDSDGHEWAIKLNGDNPQKIKLRMHKGWLDFYMHHRLKTGDTCVFKLNRGKVTENDLFFNVEIVRAG